MIRWVLCSACTKWSPVPTSSAEPQCPYHELWREPGRCGSSARSWETLLNKGEHQWWNSEYLKIKSTSLASNSWSLASSDPNLPMCVRDCDSGNWHINTLERYHQCLPNKILKIHWKDRQTIRIVLTCAKMVKIMQCIVRVGNAKLSP